MHPVLVTGFKQPLKTNYTTACYPLYHCISCVPTFDNASTTDTSWPSYSLLHYLLPFPTNHSLGFIHIYSHASHDWVCVCVCVFVCMLTEWEHWQQYGPLQHKYAVTWCWRWYVFGTSVRRWESTLLGYIVIGMICFLLVLSSCSVSICFVCGRKYCCAVCCTHTHTQMDCTVEVDGSIVLVISEWVGECTVRFWKSRSLNNDHMVRCRGCSMVVPLAYGLHVYAEELRLSRLWTGWLLHYTGIYMLSGLVKCCRE